jgi:polyisoprenoid-binding protein YceI
VLTITGENGLVEGRPVISEGKVSGKFEVQLSSFTTGITSRDENMLEDLHATDYPVATYVMEPSPFKGSNTFPFTGTLELNGKKKRLYGEAHFNGGVLQAEILIRLSEFKVNRRMYSGIGVGEAVTVTIEVAK